MNVASTRKERPSFYAPIISGNLTSVCHYTAALYVYTYHGIDRYVWRGHSARNPMSFFFIIRHQKWTKSGPTLLFPMQGYTFVVFPHYR